MTAIRKYRNGDVMAAWYPIVEHYAVIKKCNCKIAHFHYVKAHDGVEAQLHAFLTGKLDGVWRSDSPLSPVAEASVSVLTRCKRRKKLLQFLFHAL